MSTGVGRQLGIDLQDQPCPPEIRRLGRTITNWTSYGTRSILYADHSNWSLLDITPR